MSLSFSELQDELAKAHRMRDRKLEKLTIRQLAQFYANEGQWGRWLSCEEQALPLARTMSTPQETVEILCNLGTAYTEANQPERALVYLEEALQMARTASLPRHEAVALNSLGRAYSLSDTEKSLASFEAALRVGRKLHPKDEITLLQGALWAAERANQPERAKVYLKLGIQCARQIKDRAAEGHFLLELGLVFAHQEAFDEASRCLKTAKTLLASNNASEDLARCENALGQLPPTPEIEPQPLPPKITNEPLTSPSQRLEKDPRDVLGLVGRAEAYLASGKPELALQDAEQARQIIISEPRLKNKIRQSLLARTDDLKKRAQATKIAIKEMEK